MGLGKDPKSGSRPIANRYAGLWLLRRSSGKLNTSRTEEPRGDMRSAPSFQFFKDTSPHVQHMAGIDNASLMYEVYTDVFVYSILEVFE